MAPLKIIGAGMGRTGTDSLRTALNTLGYNTHHMKAFNEEGGRAEMFVRAYENPEESVDWDYIYDGYDAAVDWPTCSFVGPLMKKYPDAKVILTIRDPDNWYHRRDPRLKDNAQVQMTGNIILDGAFNNAEQFEDEEAMKAKFVRNNDQVKAIVPQESLLILNLGDGWEPLCKFLDKLIPDEPYPHVNSTVEMWEKFPELAPSERLCKHNDKHIDLNNRKKESILY